MRRFILSALVLFPIGVVACGDSSGTQTNPDPDPGSLVAVSIDSTVGVLLEDFPAASRDRIATELLAKPESFWQERAALQLRLTSLKLVYREYYYEDVKDSLTLPPEEAQTFEFAATGAARQTIDGHDVVAIDFTMRSTLLSDVESPGVTEPALAEVGGVWDEAFVLPVDPTLLLQRTGYACMDEDQFPPESVDAENAYEFYDDTCEVEPAGEEVCHLSGSPQETCIEAVESVIGKVVTSIHYERLAWDAALADQVRVGEVTVEDAPDLKVLTTGFQSLTTNRVIYKYFPVGHCATMEEPACVGGPGWRRLLAFDSIDQNVGGQPLHIGPVDYYAEGFGGELIDHNVYNLSDCHGHYHFLYYGNFGFGSGAGEAVQKNGFCLESTGRRGNHELSPLHTPYSCENQGVSAGWVDLYAAGLTCNWVDVTDVDTSAGAVTDKLFFQSNPDGFMCEGQLEKDASGNQVWETTEFTSPAGDPVDKPACTEAEGLEANDRGEVDVTLKQVGGMMSSACVSTHDLGPLRNCGFTQQPTLVTCTPGQSVTINCTGGAATQPQVVRVCETSQVLGGGVDCAHREALANVVVEGPSTAVTFTCPTMRDATEAGGEYAIYTAAVWEPDGTSAVVCTP